MPHVKLKTFTTALLSFLFGKTLDIISASLSVPGSQWVCNGRYLRFFHECIWIGSTKHHQSQTPSRFFWPQLPLSHSTSLSPRQIDEHPLHNMIVMRSLISARLILRSGLHLLWLNYQLRTFAGKYKLNTILDRINLTLKLFKIWIWA